MGSYFESAYFCVSKILFQGEVKEALPKVEPRNKEQKIVRKEGRHT